jgi:serine phosphatase RsbU (regulator of sigma subunit)
LIQTSLLPDLASMGRRVRELFILYRPRDIVGGDFYYFRDRGDAFLLAVIDCTGHGVPGAFMTMTAKAVLDNLLETADGSDPAATLREFNRRIRQALHPEKGERTLDNGLEMGLCWCAPERGLLVFAGARINLLAVVDGALISYPGDRQAIGYRRSAEDFSYTNHRLNLAGRESFFLASDGILDQVGGAKGWGFGSRRFHTLLTAIARLPAAEQQAAIEKALAEYQGDFHQRDDITVIGLKP